MMVEVLSSVLLGVGCVLAQVEVDVVWVPTDFTGDDGDLAEVRGHSGVKWILEIAAGAHNLLLVGPPGSDKVMLSRPLSEILPSLTLDKVLEVTTGPFVVGPPPPEEAPPYRMTDQAV